MSTTLCLKVLVWMLLVGLGCGPGAAQAQAQGPTRLPSAAEMEAARGRLSSAAEIDAAMRTQSVPTVPPTALDPARQGLDLSALAAQYDRLRGLSGPPDAQAPGSAPAQRSAQGLLVFASLGMPAASLERLVQDAEASGAVIVLRGVLGGDLRATLKRIEALMGTRRVTWQIDPPLFERFGVQAVPAYVLVDPTRPVLLDCGAPACSEPVFAKLSGDVTAAHALQVMAAQDPRLQAEAQRRLRLLRGRQ